MSTLKQLRLLGLAVVIISIVSQTARATTAGDMMAMGPMAPGETFQVTQTDSINNLANAKYAEGRNILDIPGSGKWSELASHATRNDVVILRGDVLFDSGWAEVYTLALYPGAHLHFQTTASTVLSLVNLQVFAGATLTIGTAADPVNSDVIARIVIRDEPFNTAVDPGQFGHGLVVAGTVHMHGRTLSRTFARLSTEPKAGDTTLVLDGAVSGWSAGDKLVLPDTRQLIDSDLTSQSDSQVRTAVSPQWEELSVASVGADGRTIALTSALQWDHLGARDRNGALTFLPHAGNLGRNIVIESENPSGTRGHTMFLHMAVIDVEYVQFKDLGRTRVDPLDSATYDSQGNVTHIGTNQIGRYAVHIHHVSVPGSSDSYQYRLVGNAVDSTTKWGIALHDAHFGLVSGNVIYDADGAGLATETGNETGNLIENNFAVRSDGSGHWVEDRGALTATDFGHEGTGFWFHGSQNIIRGNVAANNREAGMLVYQALAPDQGNSVRFPLFPGADLESGQLDVDYTIDLTENRRPIDFSGNEMYGQYNIGYELWRIQDRNNQSQDYIVKDAAAWSVRGYGVIMVDSIEVRLDNLKIRGNGHGIGVIGMTGGFVLNNPDIQGEANEVIWSDERITSLNYYSVNAVSWNPLPLTVSPNGRVDTVLEGLVSFMGGPFVAYTNFSISKVFPVSWTQISGPAGAPAVFMEDSAGFVTGAEFYAPGSYLMRFTAADDHLDLLTSDIRVVVNNSIFNSPSIVATGTAIGITATRATLTGTVNPNGTPTTAFFEYGPTISYGTTSGAVDVGVGASDVPVGIPIGRLKCSTPYHFRIVGLNSAGTTTGSDATFFTPSCDGPTVALTSSATAFFAPATVILTATTGDSGASKVDFYDGSTVIGTDVTSPFNLTWSNVGVGTYRVTAVATDSLGRMATSNAVSITVGAPLPPATNIMALSGNLAFGNVAINTTVTRTLTIGNTGVTLLTVSGISYPAGFSGDWAGGPIAAGGSQNVTVMFAPTARTSYGGPITVMGDQTSGVNTIAVSGSGGASLGSQTLLTTQLPASTFEGSYELGLRLVPDTTGQITAVRFWKPVAETGPHTGRVWSASGQLLASVAFTSETASGWQEQTLPSPVVTLADTAYIVSVNANGSWVGTEDFFSTPLVNGHLQGPPTSGVYGIAGTFSTATYENYNYFRDVVFVADVDVPTRIIGLSGNLAFGTVAINTTATRTLTISNTGDTLLTVSGISYPVGFGGDWASGTIAAGGSQTVTVTFAPTAAESSGGPITVTGDETSGVNTIAVSGTGDVSQGPQTLLTTQVPASESWGSYELGLRLVADTAGQITAVRFWKPVGETGPHTGRVWSASGQLLASVVFTSETASGWQEQTLASPVVTLPDTAYIVSVNANNSWVGTGNFFSTPLVNGSLQGPPDGNGVYGIAGTFPTATYQSYNYFRDVVFLRQGL